MRLDIESSPSMMTCMKIFALADNHGRRLRDERTADLIKQADLLLIAGDITQFGSDRDAEPIIDQFYRLNTNIMAVSGNCDQPSVVDFLEERKISVHGRAELTNDLVVFGCGGSNLTPFSTVQEYSEDEIDRTLAGINMSRPHARFRLFLTHAPPHGTKVDRTLLGGHVGSRAIRAFIETAKPDIVICGHIHEARGVDRIENTIVINPGTFPDHYTILELGDRISYSLDGDSPQLLNS